MTLTLASIHIHPIKSLGGFMVKSARITDRGLEHDRRWMLVDRGGTFVTQREHAMMACLHCTPIDEGFRVTDVRDGSFIDVPWSIPGPERVRVQVWSSKLAALGCDALADRWFSERLGVPLRLVYMPSASKRRSSPFHAPAGTLNSFSDAYPYMLLSRASLDDLNARLEQALPLDRFRANLVIAGGHAFQEDAWRDVRIGGAHMQLVKPCARCVMTTVDQRMGKRSAEPLRTLATYRLKGNNVLFGMNAVALSGSEVHVGDILEPLA